jgi:teichuronic acid biosynthesis glycosyltransferase TuaG
MNSAPISIVTPAWKAARFVTDTIRSVQAQTWTDWELWVVDDCSPDDTAATVERAAAGDPRVKLIRQPRNGGPAAARNAALEAARGRWIAFLDSDDLWLPDKLQAQLDFHRAAGCRISFTEFRRITEDGASTGRLIEVPDRLDYAALLCNTAIATSTVIVDREATGPFRMKKTYYDDFACWLELLRPGGIALGLHRDLMRYRVVGQSVSRNKRNSSRMVWKTYREVEKHGPIHSAWCFANYSARAWLKYRTF